MTQRIRPKVVVVIDDDEEHDLLELRSGQKLTRLLAAENAFRQALLAEERKMYSDILVSTGRPLMETIATPGIVRAQARVRGIKGRQQAAAARSVQFVDEQIAEKEAEKQRLAEERRARQLELEVEQRWQRQRWDKAATEISRVIRGFLARRRVARIRKRRAASSRFTDTLKWADDRAVELRREQLLQEKRDFFQQEEQIRRKLCSLERGEWDRIEAVMFAEEADIIERTVRENARLRDLEFGTADMDDYYADVTIRSTRAQELRFPFDAPDVSPIKSAAPGSPVRTHTSTPPAALLWHTPKPLEPPLPLAVILPTPPQRPSWTKPTSAAAARFPPPPPPPPHPAEPTPPRAPRPPAQSTAPFVRGEQTAVYSGYRKAVQPAAAAPPKAPAPQRSRVAAGNPRTFFRTLLAQVDE
eukprot:TRINITY_DN10370_c0_g1_i1.p1 TRINITY_DN10370_c0_g1~~TRINITY_DN10370_c0_g1_i1.p1  ORF type:complete len:424 (+),score=66.88 TRINITY_DN10370_c0_g1_i1:28-1272(+)